MNLTLQISHSKVPLPPGVVVHGLFIATVPHDDFLVLFSTLAMKLSSTGKSGSFCFSVVY